MNPKQSPGLGYKRVMSCKDSFHGTDVLAVSEHGAPERRPNIHAHFVGRQRDGLDTTAGPRRRGKPKHSHRGHPVLGPWRRTGGFSLVTASGRGRWSRDRKSTRLNSSHGYISYAVFCLKKKINRRASTVTYSSCYATTR